MCADNICISVCLLSPPSAESNDYLNGMPDQAQLMHGFAGKAVKKIDMSSHGAGVREFLHS